MTPKSKPPGTPDPVPIPDEDFSEFVEWTVEEEEEFLRILNDPENDGMDGATT